MNASEYQKYLESDHWQELRIQCRNRDGMKCSICLREKGLQCHHWKYRDTPHHTLLEDLILLCGPCHAMIHRNGCGSFSKQELIEKYRERFMSKPKPRPVIPHPQKPPKPALHPGSKGHQKGLKSLEKLKRKQSEERNQIARKSRDMAIASLSLRLGLTAPSRPDASAPSSQAACPHSIPRHPPRSAPS